MSYLNLQDKIRIRCGRYKVGSPTLNSQPGAHTGSTRKYIPGYSDANIIYRAPATGSDSNDGLTELTPKQTKSACDTAAGSTKKIRIIEACTLNESVSKPTEMKRGISGTISSSLTAPVATWTQAGTINSYGGSRHGIAWVPWLSKFYCVGGTSKLYSTPDGDTFTAIAGHGFGSSTPTCITVSVKRKLIIIAGDGKIGYSTDGVTFTVYTVTSGTLNGIHYDDGSDVLVAVGSVGTIVTSSDQCATFSVQSLDSVPTFYGVAKSPDLWVITTTADDVYTSTNGVQWTLRSISVSEAWVTVFYSKALNKFLLGGESGYIYYSADGISWSAAGTPSFGGDVVYGFSESLELAMVVAVGGSGKIAYSSDGNAFAQAGTPSYGGSDVFAVGYSPLLGKFLSGGASNKAARSTAFANTISASIAGFSIQAVQYSGTVTAYNCTMRQPGTTAILATDSCRITYGAHISNNVQAHIGTLAEGSFDITGAPAYQNAIAVNCCTIIGRMSPHNSSSTTYEQFRDNIMEGGFSAAYATVIQSGNLRGTNTNGLLSKSVRFDDPGFVDTTDYKLKRKTQGDAIDSPLVAAASYYVNEQGEQRDIGAWSLDDSALPYDYRETFFITKPAGQGLKPKKVPMASADQGIDGEWDSTNEPARASEYLTFQCASVPIEDLQAQDYIESKTDLTCEVCLDPQELSPTTPIVVNGAHSIGDVVLNIDGSTTIKSGMILPIGGKNYFVMYTIGGATATKLVLNEPLKSSVSDNAEIIPNEPVGYGTYQYVPQQRETPRPHSQEKDIVLNVVWSFVRQYPQL